MDKKEEIHSYLNARLQCMHLCNLCTMGNNCPYKDRIENSCKIMDEENLKLKETILNTLGENPYENSYERLTLSRGPIVKCNAYKGALDIDNLYPRKVISLCGDVSEGTFKKFHEKLTLEGNIVMSVDFFSHFTEHIYDEEVQNFLINTFINKIFISDKLIVLTTKEENELDKTTKTYIDIARKFNKEIKIIRK